MGRAARTSRKVTPRTSVSKKVTPSPPPPATVDEIVGALQRDGVGANRARRFIEALREFGQVNKRAERAWKDVQAHPGLAVLFSQVPGLTPLATEEIEAIRRDVRNRLKPLATDTLSIPQLLEIEEWPADGWPRRAWVLVADEATNFAGECLTVDELIRRWGCTPETVEKHLRTGALRAMVDISNQRIESALGDGRGLLGTYRLLHPRPAQVLAGPVTDALVFRWVAVTSDDTLAVRPIEFALTGIHPPLSRSDLRVPLAEVERFEREHPEAVGTRAVPVTDGPPAAAATGPRKPSHTPASAWKQRADALDLKREVADRACVLDLESKGSKSLSWIVRRLAREYNLGRSTVYRYRAECMNLWPARLRRPSSLT